MKIRFDTRPGVDTRRWECLLEVYCTPENETPGELLQRGWLFDPLKDAWYMSRSVRVDLSRWMMSKSEIDSLRSYEWEETQELSSEDAETLAEYRREREIVDYPYSSFEKYGALKIERGLSKFGSCWYMTSHFGSTSLYPICAYRKSGTKTSPGKACWTRACQVSKEMGSTHLYVYEGYGLGSAYKASTRGFEWWNGEAWSTDAGDYLEVLKRDGVI